MTSPASLVPADGAQNGAALAQATEDLLGNPGSNATPAPAQPAPGATEAAPAPITSVRIGTEVLPLAQVEELVTKGRQFESPEFADARNINTILASFSEDEVHHVLDAIDQVKTARDEGRTLSTVVSEGDVTLPKDYRPVATEDMSDDAATVALRVEDLNKDLRRQIRKLTGIVQQQGQLINSMAQRVADEDMAAAVQPHVGFKVTADLVREWRANGITDPTKAIPFLTKGKAATNGAATAATNGAPPPAPTHGNGEKTFDATDPNIYGNIAELRRRWDAGERPSDPAHTERLEQMLRDAGYIR